jgi:hypothetical protein
MSLTLPNYWCSTFHVCCFNFAEIGNASSGFQDCKGNTKFFSWMSEQQANENKVLSAQKMG